MGLYIYVAAAALAVIGILSVYKINIEKIKKDPEEAAKIQQNFFIGVAISEALPIVLLIIGMMNMQPVQSMEELYFPVIITAALMIYAVFFIFLHRNAGTDDDAKAAVRPFSYVALAVTMSIPVIALVFIFMAAPVS